MQIPVTNQKTKSIRPASRDAELGQPVGYERDGRRDGAGQDADHNQLDDRAPTHGRPRIYLTRAGVVQRFPARADAGT